MEGLCCYHPILMDKVTAARLQAGYRPTMNQTLYVDTDNIEHVLTLLMIGLVHHRSPKRAFYELCSVGGSRLMSAFGGRALGDGRRSDRIQDSL